MYSIEEMRKMTIQQLTPLAKKYGIVRLHSMRKSEVIERLCHLMNDSSDSLDSPLKDCKKEAKLKAMESLSNELLAQRPESQEAAAEETGTNAIAAGENAGTLATADGGTDRVNGALGAELGVTSAMESATGGANAGIEAGAGSAQSTGTEAGAAAGRVPTTSSAAEAGMVKPAFRTSKTAGATPKPAVVRSALSSSEPSLFNKQFQMMNLAYMPDVTEEDVQEESLYVTVMDPYWLHVTWTIRRRTIERAKAALGQSWYEAKPILRVNVLRGNDGGSNGRSYHEKDVLIHGRSNHWFIAATDPPRTYLVEIGYLSRKGFFALLRSNVVSTPQIRSVLRYERSADVSWMTACDLRPAQTPDWSPSNHVLSRKWTSKSSSLFSVEEEDAEGNSTKHDTMEDYPFRISTEMVIYGSTSPDSQVTANEEWVAVQPDGTFMLRVDVPEQGKQILTLDSTNRRESQKINLTLERTTQVQKPQKLGEEKAQ